MGQDAEGVRRAQRCACMKRTTRETDITLTLNLDGSGKSDIHTGIGFFDHMLEGFAKHGFFDLTVQVNGDLHVDGHHTVEDTGRPGPGHCPGCRRQGRYPAVMVFSCFPWMMRLL